MFSPSGTDMNYLVLMKHNLIQPAIASGIASNITLLQETLSHLERICNTPLPFAYQAHLRMSLWYACDSHLTCDTQSESFQALSSFPAGMYLKPDFHY
jgi:hypothetical protein